MYISLFWLVLALCCTCIVHSSSCVIDHDCYTGTSIQYQCCNQRCYAVPYDDFRCSCLSNDDCPYREICSNIRRCDTPTENPTTRPYIPTPRKYGCKVGSSSNCEEGEICYRSLCRTRTSLRDQSTTHQDRRDVDQLLSILLPILIPVVVFPCLVYCTVKLKNMEERRRQRRWGLGYRPPLPPAPQNHRAGGTTVPTTSQASELQSVNTAASSHNDHTVIQLERLAPSAPQLSPSGEAREATTGRISQGPHQQAESDVSSATVIGYPSSLPPSASSPYNEERRVQYGEDAPPSYEEAIKNYHVVARL